MPSCSVVDPHHVDADPDSTYHPDADPDSDFYFMRMRIRLFTRMRMRIRILIRLFTWCGSGSGQSGNLIGYSINFSNLTKYWFSNTKRFMRIRIRISLWCRSGCVYRSWFLFDADRDPYFHLMRIHADPDGCGSGSTTLPSCRYCTIAHFSLDFFEGFHMNLSCWLTFFSFFE